MNYTTTGGFCFFFIPIKISNSKVKNTEIISNNERGANSKDAIKKIGAIVNCVF